MNNKILTIAVIFTAILAIVVLIVSMFLNTKLSAPLTVNAVYPENGAQNISVSPQIRVTFSRQLTKTEEKAINLSISPSVQNNLSWENTNNSFSINLDETLLPQTNYLITVNYPGNSYSWGFKTQTLTITPTPTQNNTSTDVLEQGQDDAKFSQSQADFLNSHPWYDNLPPENDQYYINFDASKNDFFVLLYPKKQSSLSIDSQVAQLKTNVINELKSLGVNTSSYAIEWTIIPQ